MVTQSKLLVANLPDNPYITRPARALIGWLAQDVSHALLAGGVSAVAALPETVARVSRARAEVQRRSPLTPVTGIISDVGPELQDHLSQLSIQPAYAPFSQEGWSFKIVDLTKVRAVQPVVHTDHAIKRTQTAVADNMPSLANITLPLSRQLEALPIEYDDARKSWIILGRNPNLQITGNYAGEVKADNGVVHKCFGFTIGIAQSFVQVVLHRGCYILRDGYHRAHGLLERNVTHAPVLFREIPDNDHLGLGAGLLPAADYLGSRAPLLTDYFDATVSADIEVLSSQKMILIQGLELTPKLG